MLKAGRVVKTKSGVLLTINMEVRRCVTSKSFWADLVLCWVVAVRPVPSASWTLRIRGVMARVQGLVEGAKNKGKIASERSMGK
jgi:hypothetical protein